MSERNNNPHILYLIQAKLITHSAVIIDSNVSTCIISYLPECFFNELFESVRSDALVLGQIVSINTHTAQGIFFCEPSNVRSRIEVQLLCQIPSINIGPFNCYAVIDSLGRVLSNPNSVMCLSTSSWIIDGESPGIVVRQSVCEPMLTGLVNIDALIPPIQ